MAIKAFPGAYGWGAQSIGGRGGTVIEVTNLDNTGAGSLRNAIKASGHRIVVFRVSGLITLTSNITIKNPYLTVAGQTAPGGGIHIKGAKLVAISHNLIFRYLRWRGEANSGISIQPGVGNEAHDIIIDHSSFSWGESDNIDIWKEANTGIPDICNITVQNCIIAEPEPSHPTGMLIGAQNKGYDAIDEIHHISIHHNLFIHNSYRNPRISAKHSEVINNVVYNWGDRIGGTERTSEVDWINNYFKAGPMSGSGKTYWLRHVSWPNGGNPVYDNASLYFEGNIAPERGFPFYYTDNWAMLREYSNPGKGDIISLDHRRYNKLESAPFPIKIQPTDDVYDSVLADVGANARLDSNGNWIPNIDSVDSRLLADVIDGTGPADYHDITVPGTIGDIDAGTAYDDTDSDGIPDDWENYTNVEMFLNGN